MKKGLIVMAAAGLLGADIAYAQSGAEVAKAKCMACHEQDKKKVGPAMNDIAAKHKGAKDAPAKLVAMLKEGKGHMKVSASDDELKAAVQHFLSQK